MTIKPVFMPAIKSSQAIREHTAVLGGNRGFIDEGKETILSIFLCTNQFNFTSLSMYHFSFFTCLHRDSCPLE